MPGVSSADRVVVHNPGGDVEVALGDPIVLRGAATYVATCGRPLTLIDRQQRERIVLVVSPSLRAVSTTSRCR